MSAGAGLARLAFLRRTALLLRCAVRQSSLHPACGPSRLRSCHLSCCSLLTLAAGRRSAPFTPLHSFLEAHLSRPFIVCCSAVMKGANMRTATLP